MGDEYEHDWVAYKRAQANEKSILAPVIPLRPCTPCKGVGHHGKDEPCICVQNFQCPVCGTQHPRPWAWAMPNGLLRCSHCNWQTRIGEKDES